MIERLVRPIRVVALLPLLCAACYRTAAVEVGALPVGASAMFTLSGGAVERVRRDSLQARLLDDFTVSGRLVRRAGDSIVVAVPVRVADPGALPSTVLRELSLLTSDVRSTAQRTLDRRRSIYTAATFVAATAVASGFIVFRGGRASGNSGRPVDPVEHRLPLLRLRAW
ncbi:MAG: hypothetical protein MUE41_16955 [Gemmatimonadaceae bacterium]|jgi:hypothetical protein|nr:hypothetical protein [Gemmatimonadaceae bacterium]